LYRLDADHTVTQILRDVTISNGLGWSPDDATMYYIDTAGHAIDSFDYDIDTGSATNRRRLADIPATDGLPDGLAVDVQGYIWVALYGGWCVQRFAPDGTVDARVALPVAKVTSCAFGDDDLSSLYITSAASGLTADELIDQPFAGALFRYRPGVAGRPEAPFAG
jgi:sugar lactone lactonase YvrE